MVPNRATHQKYSSLNEIQVLNNIVPNTKLYIKAM